MQTVLHGDALASDGLAGGAPIATEVWFVGALDTRHLPPEPRISPELAARTVVLSPDQLGGALAKLDGSARLAALFLPLDRAGSFRPLAATLREDARYRRTRVYLLRIEPGACLAPGSEDEHDIEGVLPWTSPNAAQWTHAIERAVGAFQALRDHPTTAYYFLDNKFNDVFSWFERTRWDISEAPELTDIDRRKLTHDQIDVIKHAAIAEFGTLPGAHNFLREWGDEVSFSNWALAWGAEEARHSLLLCRYLREIGVEVMSKHAIYKRRPYDPGPTQASTLMMNVVSETRAAEAYKRFADLLDEPVAKALFTLLSRDEARHASAFAQFCRELCGADERQKSSAMAQAYFWLAQQSGGGFRHPAGEFYPHTATAEGFASTEERLGRGSTDAADRTILRMIRKIIGDESIRSCRDVKRWLREQL